MSWSEHHATSEQLASAAELATRRGDSRAAIELYRKAAEAEYCALDNVDQTKARTLGITLVSTVSLYYKAGEFKQAQAIAEKWLNIDSLPTFAKDEIEDILLNIKSKESLHNQPFNKGVQWALPRWARRSPRKNDTDSATTLNVKNKPLRNKDRSYLSNVRSSIRNVTSLALILVLILSCVVSYTAGKSTWMQTARANNWVPETATSSPWEKNSLIERDASGRSVKLRINLLSNEVKWKLASSNEIEINSQDADLSRYIRRLDLSSAQAIVCVGAASAQGERVMAEALARQRMGKLLALVREEIHPTVPLYGLNIGQFKGRESSSDSKIDEAQRRIVIIEIAGLEEGVNLSDALHSALSIKSNPFSPLDIDNYSLFQLSNAN